MRFLSSVLARYVVFSGLVSQMTRFLAAVVFGVSFRSGATIADSFASSIHSEGDYSLDIYCKKRGQQLQPCKRGT